MFRYIFFKRFPVYFFPGFFELLLRFVAHSFNYSAPPTYPTAPCRRTNAKASKTLNQTSRSSQITLKTKTTQSKTPATRNYFDTVHSFLFNRSLRAYNRSIAFLMTFLRHRSAQIYGQWVRRRCTHGLRSQCSRQISFNYEVFLRYIPLHSSI